MKRKRGGRRWGHAEGGSGGKANESKRDHWRSSAVEGKSSLAISCKGGQEEKEKRRGERERRKDGLYIEI